MNFITRIWNRLFNRTYIDISLVEQWRRKGIVPFFNNHTKNQPECLISPKNTIRGGGWNQTANLLRYGRDTTIQQEITGNLGYSPKKNGSGYLIW